MKYKTRGRVTLGKLNTGEAIIVVSWITIGVCGAYLFTINKDYLDLPEATFAVVMTWITVGFMLFGFKQVRDIERK